MSLKHRDEQCCERMLRERAFLLLRIDIQNDPFIHALWSMLRVNCNISSYFFSGYLWRFDIAMFSTMSFALFVMVSFWLGADATMSVEALCYSSNFRPCFEKGKSKAGFAGICLQSFLSFELKI